MDVVFIKFKNRYEDCTEDIGIAINIKTANKYIDKLIAEYPLCYGSQYGTFLCEVFKVIE